ncbi:indole-3-glycerol phosphate synthase TrpC [Calderihabitans maritimus]|uniref:Indole-3-glycerol phosphate synthase n=1 Tax=Calderihabitans maritimus TaxID=1246530 RepID=A0A1Z5HNT8_9FIRM|nr:indole-3-glycerol phosphate synthase TrpC [Calderihabitans maritimus]GAW90991.1 indole-3-glycerol phosphate synthase [Calderihabitans maritimus]
MILQRILVDKKEEIKNRRRKVPLHLLEERIQGLPPTRDLVAALQAPGIRIIAELKKASPSRGVIRPNFDPAAIARIYERGGAAAISVLTDQKYFQGDLSFLSRVKEVVSLPLLRKDFIIDPYQVVESRAHGADAILLIAAAMTRDLLEELLQLARKMQLTCLVEIHTREELEMVLDTPARVIGINNRDLNTFTTDLKVTVELAGLVPPDRILVSESGIRTRRDIEFLKNHGVNAFLIGESLMMSENVEKKMAEFLGHNLEEVDHDRSG